MTRTTHDPYDTRTPTAYGSTPASAAYAARRYDEIEAAREIQQRHRLAAVERGATRRARAKLALDEAAQALRTGGPAAFVAAARAMRRAEGLVPELGIY